MRIASIAALAALSLALPAPSVAATYLVTGTRTNITPPPSPGVGRCSPAFSRTISILPGNFVSTGMSNFGSFTASMSHCETVPQPTNVLDGLFTLDFDAGGSLFGTYTGNGTITPGTPGISIFHDWTVTGGTGRFLGASGTLLHNGVLTGGLYMGMPAGTYVGSFEGRLSLPAIPEPATWALLITGFGLTGAMLRRRRAFPERQTA